jgi:signal transduction histidine kinase
VARTQGLTREVTVQDERRRLLGRVLQAAEDERTRIAHDLHDGPGQQLAVSTATSTAPASASPTARPGHRGRPDAGPAGDRRGAGGVEKGLGEETRVLRHLMGGLRPPVLDNRGFAEALAPSTNRNRLFRSGGVI